MVAALSAPQLRDLVGKMRDQGVLYDGLRVLGGGSILGAIAVFVIDRNFMKASGFMHGEQIGLGQTPTVAMGYLVINGRYPAMVRVTSGGAAVAVEIWSAVSVILVKEPDGLTIGRVRLADGSVVLGVLGELAACEGQKEITAFRRWRNYLTTLTGNS